MSITIARQVAYVPPIYPPQRPTAEMNARVLAYTNEVFPGAQVAIFPEKDVEYGYEYTVVDVVFKGSVDDILERSHMWSRGLRQIAPGFQLEYCLSVFPQ